MESVAGLDLALNRTGIGIVLSDGSVICKSIKYDIAASATERDRIERVIRITNEIMGILKSYGVKHVGIEDYAFSGHKMTLLAELTGNLKVQVYLGLKAIPFMIAANSVRKYHLGKDCKKKEKLREYLRSRGYSQPSTLDESDALAVALIVNDWVNQRDKITNTQQFEVFDRFARNQSQSKKSKMVLEDHSNI